MHYAVAVFLSFLIGQLLHAWLRAQSSVHSNLNGILTYRQYVEVNGANLCVRLFLAWLVVSAWAWHGQELMTLIAKISPDNLGWLSTNAIPLNPTTAGVFGYFGDSIIDGGISLISRWIPSLKNEVPPTSGASKAVVQAQQAVADAKAAVADAKNGAAKP
jgi:hypothetical protein